MTPVQEKGWTAEAMPGWLGAAMVGIGLSGLMWLPIMRSPPWGTMILLPLLVAYWLGRRAVIRAALTKARASE